MTTDEQLIHDEIIASLRKDNDRFHRELPEMRNQNKRLTGFLQDAAAFIRIANSGKGNWNSNIVLATLIHDINGLAEDQPCFLPRVSGYAKRERDEKTRVAQSYTRKENE